MRRFSFLFFFVFSPAVFNTVGHNGSPEKDKQEEVEVTVAPQNVNLEVSSDSLSIAIKTLSDWQTASGTYYDPKDSSQTRSGTDGKGSFGRMVQSGSIALGSTFTKFFLQEKERIKVYIEIKNLNVVTPFGKGIFRLDDSMGKCPSSPNDFFLDFHEGNLTNHLKRAGRFNVVFRIHRIEEFK